jgi:hypothetical protein
VFAKEMRLMKLVIYLMPTRSLQVVSIGAYARAYSDVGTGLATQSQLPGMQDLGCISGQYWLPIDQFGLLWCLGRLTVSIHPSS